MPVQAATSLTTELAQYVDTVLTQARAALIDFDLDELKLTPLGLVTFYFIYQAIDGNEQANKVPDDYLLILPDAALSEEALQGAVLGALLSKYRANYIASERQATRYEVGDILLHTKRNGDFQLWQIEPSGGRQEIRASAFGRPQKGVYVLNPETLGKCIRLLSRRQAKEFSFGTRYPTAGDSKLVAKAVGIIRASLRQAPLISTYPHRMGIVCASGTADFVAEAHPMPLRDWSTHLASDSKATPSATPRHNSRMLLPLEPMAETARTYQHLVGNVFRQRGQYNQVEELLIFDVRQYCDGNGKFDNLLQGRNQGYYRNLVLVGSRAPYTQPHSLPHSFRRWEWTPEELLVLQNKELHYPEVELVSDPVLRALHHDALTEWTALEAKYNLDLALLRRLLPLFYRLVLPPAADENAEARVQTLGMQQWVADKLKQQSIFSDALLYDPAQRQAITATLLRSFEQLATHLGQYNAKFGQLRSILTPSSGALPAYVVLVVSRRDVANTQAALDAVLSADERQRLRVIDGGRLSEYLQEPVLAQPNTVWVLSSLRIGRRADNELSMYRRLLMSSATVKLLAYEGVEEGRYSQLASLHLHLLEQALSHSDRSRFVNSQLIISRLLRPIIQPDILQDRLLLTSAPPTTEALSFTTLNAVFGDPGDGRLHSSPATGRISKVVAQDDELDSDLLPAQGQQCRLYFEGGYSRKVAYNQPLDVLVALPTGTWPARRLPATLRLGEEVLLLKANSPRLLDYLRQQEPTKFAAVDAATARWQAALRRLAVHYYGNIARLHVKLKDHGLRLQLTRLEQWFQPDSPMRFPRAKKNVRAIASLEQEVFGLSAVLPTCLPEVLAQRQVYNMAVKGASRPYRHLLLHGQATGDHLTGHQALGKELYSALQESIMTCTFRKLEML